MTASTASYKANEPDQNSEWLELSTRRPRIHIIQASSLQDPEVCPEMALVIVIVTKAFKLLCMDSMHLSFRPFNVTVFAVAVQLGKPDPSRTRER
jgi:hypothetical protein